MSHGKEAMGAPEDPQEYLEYFKEIDEQEGIASKEAGRKVGIFSDKFEKTGEYKYKVLEIMVCAKARMATHWGINSLSTIEEVALRKIVERILPVWEAALERYKKNPRLGFRGFDLEVEAAARWLMEMYDIRPPDIPKNKRGYVDVLFKEYLRRLREKAHQPFVEMKPADRKKLKTELREILKRDKN